MTVTKYSKLTADVLAICKEKLQIEDVLVFTEILQVELLKDILKNSSCLYIIKKNGKIENFDPEKIKVSLARASDDIGEPLTGSDLEILTKEIILTVKKNKEKIIYSKKIKDYAIDALEKLGFAYLINVYSF